MFSNEPAIRDDGAHVVVILRGELDIANAADLGTVLSEAVARNPYVIADLSDLTLLTAPAWASWSGHGRGHGRLAGTWFSPGRAEGCGGSSPCRSWLVCSLSMPAWTRRRGKVRPVRFVISVQAGIRFAAVARSLVCSILGGQAAPRRMRRAGLVTCQ